MEVPLWLDAHLDAAIRAVVVVLSVGLVLGALTRCAVEVGADRYEVKRSVSSSNSPPPSPQELPLPRE